MNDAIKRNLVAAISIKRNKQKMAKGGDVKSAANEARPMPEETNADKPEVKDNSDKAPLKQAGWTDTPERKQASKGLNITRIKHPKMVPSDAVSARLMDSEDDLEASAKPGKPKAQPSKVMDEEEASKSGPSTPALKMKMMAEGGTAGNPTSRIDTGYGKVIIREANGGSIDRAEDDGEENPAGLESDNDQMKPSDKEIMADHMQMLAEGGMAQPSEEAEIERHASIAAAIMAKRDAARSLDSDSDEDSVVRMAEGGEVDIENNAKEQPNQTDRLNSAALKENYDSDMSDVSQPEDSNESGDERESEESDKHDMVSAIRRKMMAKRTS